jgi:hypothetical protein
VASPVLHPGIRQEGRRALPLAGKVDLDLRQVLVDRARESETSKPYARRGFGWQLSEQLSLGVLFDGI